MKKIRIIAMFTGGAAALVMGLIFYFGYAAKPEKPRLSAPVQHATIHVGGLDRSYAFFVPAHIPGTAPLVIVLHGSTQDAEGIRKFTGYEFEKLADDNGFILVYPDGFKHNWNDCRRVAAYPARTQNIDDKGMVRALIAHFRKNYGADAARVFVTGYSNGAHLAFRLALEMPSEIAGIAAVSANLPARENLDCIESGIAIPVLIMNGTSDPINPYAGGNVSLFGLGNRGAVLSSIESARYFARLAGYGDTPTGTTALPHRDQSDPTRVQCDTWRAGGKPEIVLYSIIGGGHLIPQPVFKAPRLLGKTASDINGPYEIWSFFKRQVPAVRPRIK